ncbi:MAG TPA: hypothetical protein VNT75_24120 [Symbiobacteriaceae bacterium]|nr:hypothetical protein [Symbiobacteriaceae bacterium]
MATKRDTMFQQLPSQAKAVSDALVEVCKVITAGTAQPFAVAEVWGATAQDDIKAYVTGLNVNTDLSDAVKTIKDSSAGAAVIGGIDKVVNGIETVIAQVLAKADAVADTQMMTALTDLLKPHDQGTYGQAPFGLIPALTGIVTAAGGNPAALTGTLEEIAEAAEAVTGFAALAEFADGTLALLHKAFNPA